MPIDHRDDKLDTTGKIWNIVARLTKVHDVVPADRTIVHDNVYSADISIQPHVPELLLTPRPERNCVPLWRKRG